MNMLVIALGVVAALFSMGSFAPQVVKIWREREASSVSARMYIASVIGFGLWIAYGIGLKSWPLIASNTVCLLLAGAVLVLKLIDRRR